MSTEEDRIHRFMEHLSQGDSTGKKLKFDPGTGLIETTGGNDPDSRDLAYTPDDFKFSGDKGVAE